MKLFTAGIATETNTFSPVPTALKDFKVTRGGDYSTYPPNADGTVNMWRKMASARGWETVESVIAGAEPAGKTVKSVYEGFRDEVIADLKKAMPVDLVLLDLHGAMIADGYDDCEGDLIQHVRSVVGWNVPIGVELDLHCHTTQLMIEQADIIITFKEYPHTDFLDRGIELFNLTADAAEGKIKPHIAMYDPRMIGLFYPTQEPMKSFVDRMKALEGKDGVLSVSLGHGFPWGDMPDIGTKVLVVTDNRPEHGAALAEQLGRDLFAMRHEATPKYLSIDEALDRALAIEGGPVVLADVSDNSGGGAPGDSTFMLRRILERGIQGAAIGCIWDPIAVSVAKEAGDEAQLDLRIGGKMGKSSGDPVDLNVVVTKVAPDAMQKFGIGDAVYNVPLGDSVGVHANGVDIVLISERTQTLDPSVFTNVGIDPMTRKILVVKSTQHFFARFSPIAREVIYVAAPGAIVPDFKTIPYQNVKRPLWPLVENPFE
jgi:microcystin degradation protein MlrC